MPGLAEQRQTGRYKVYGDVGGFTGAAGIESNLTAASSHSA
jgi:hypothetical protein